MDDKTKILYDAASKNYDLGTYEEFQVKLQDPQKRKALYEAIGEEYDLGTYSEFESKVKKKEGGANGTSTSENGKSAQYQWSEISDAGIGVLESGDGKTTTLDKEPVKTGFETPSYTDTGPPEQAVKEPFTVLFNDGQSDIPIEIDEAPTGIVGGAMNVLGNAWKRGRNTGELAEQLAAGKSMEQIDWGKIAETNKRSSEIPTTPAYDKFMSSTTLKETMSNWIQDPFEITGQVVAESVSLLATYGASKIVERGMEGALGGAAIGTVAAPGAGTVAGWGLGWTTGVAYGIGESSLNAEYAGSIIESMQEAGVDITSEESMRDFVGDADKMSDVVLKAYAKGVPVALMDMVTGGIASKLAGAPAKSVMKKVGKKLIESGVEATGGMVGEAGGQLLSEGEITSIPGVFVEGAGEIATTPADVSLLNLTRKSKNGTANAKDVVEAIKNVPAERLNTTAAFTDGAGITTDLQADIENVRKADTKVPKASPQRDDVVAVVAEKEKLKAQLETTDEAFHDDINGQIEAKNNDVKMLMQGIPADAIREANEIRKAQRAARPSELQAMQDKYGLSDKQVSNIRQYLETDLIGKLSKDEQQAINDSQVIAALNEEGEQAARKVLQEKHLLDPAQTENVINVLQPEKKEVASDKKDQTGVSGGEREGQATEQAESDEGTGAQAPETGRVLQIKEKVKEKNPLFTDEEAEDVAMIVDDINPTDEEVDGVIDRVMSGEFEGQYQQPTEEELAQIESLPEEGAKTEVQDEGQRKASQTTEAEVLIDEYGKAKEEEAVQQEALDSGEIGTAEENAIARHLNKVDPESFAMFGDRNNVTPEMKRAYFAGDMGDNKTPYSIDVIAKNISEAEGVEVTPQDVVDFMTSYPNGIGAANNTKENTFYGENQPYNRSEDIAAEYKKLTGKDISEVSGEVKPNDPMQRAAEGLEEFAAAIGIIQLAEGSKRPDAVKALQKIGQGLIDAGIATVDNSIEKIKEYIKDKYGTEYTGKVDEIAAEIKSKLKPKKKQPIQRQLEKVAGVKKPVKEVTVNERTALKNQIRLEAKAARDAYREGKLERKQFAEKIKETIANLKQPLSVAQQRSLINRAANIVTERQLEKFTEYAERVIDNAEYAKSVAVANLLKKRSKKRLKSNYYGIDDGSVANALSVNPSELSNEDLNRFNNFLNSINAGAFDRKANQKDIDYFSELGLSQRKEAQQDLKSAPKEMNNESAIREFKQAREEKIEDLPEEYEQTYQELRAIKDSDLKELSPSDILELAQGYQNLRDGYYLSSKAANALREINANKSKEIGLGATEGAKFKSLLRDILLPFNLKLQGRTKLEKIQKYMSEMPLNRLDTILKGKKGTELYNTFIRPISTAYSSFIAKSDQISKEFDRLYSKIKKPDREMIKLSLISIEKEYQNNKDNAEVSPIQDYIESIQEAAKKDEAYAKKAKKYIEVYESMLENGKFDYQPQEQKLSSATKNLLQFVEKVHAETGRKVEIAAIRNGENVTIRQFYTPISVKLEQFSNLSEIEEEANSFGDDKNLTTAQSGNIKKRTKGAKPIYLEFDVNFKRANRSVLQDYYMREPLRTISRALNKIKASDIPIEQRAFFDALNQTLSRITRNTFVNNYYEGDFSAKILNHLRKKGYQMDLASVPRAGVEFTSNLSHAYVTNPKSFNKGIKTLKDVSFSDIREMARLAGTTQFTRLFEKSQSIMAEQGGFDVKSLGRLDKAFDWINNQLVGLPDRAIALPVWTGVFMDSFKTSAGKELDVAKFISSSKYREENADAIKKASGRADAVLSQGFASLNPYEGILASQVNKDDGFIKTFNKYMTRFMKFEFQSMIDAYEGALGRNELSRQEAAALGAATIVRMALYQSMMVGATNLTYTMVESLLEAADIIEPKEDEEDEMSMLNKLGNGILSAFLSIFAFRRLGNWARVPLAYGIEELNKEFGAPLRDDKDYNSYEHSLVFSPVNVDMDAYNTRAGKIIPMFMGPLNKLGKTTDRAILVLGRGGFRIGDTYVINPSAKKEETIEKNQKEFTRRIIPELFMETYGLPFPRDIRNIILRETFRDYDKDNATDNAKTEPPKKEQQRPPVSRE